MGVGVSGWTLAREVSLLGQLGVVSGTALDTILVRRLAAGDSGGHVRRAIAAFPEQGVVQRILAKYFRQDGVDDVAHAECAELSEPMVSSACVSGETRSVEHNQAPTAHRSAGQRFPLLSLPRANMFREREWIIIVANFVEVYLAKEGHAGVVGINYLHKIQFPILPSLYGAMLAGVDVVLMGAGIPGEIPSVLDRLSRVEKATVRLDVLDAGDETFEQTFDPASLWAESSTQCPQTLRRPKFLAVIASVVLAKALLKQAPGGIDGFIVESPTAGGHNAPPRGPLQLSVHGEPVYGPRDDVDMTQMAKLGVPFWLAGGYATREQFAAAIACGAQGVQIGTAFAFCEESGLSPSLRNRALEALLNHDLQVFTDPNASPTGFPFKVAELKNTLSDANVYEHRPRLCDLGYLRRAYRKADGTLGYRCAGEPSDEYAHKGGKVENTSGRKCLCNSLLANVGLGQVRKDGYEEPPLLTAGDDIACIKPFITRERLSYHARDVIEAVMQAELGVGQQIVA